MEAFGHALLSLSQRMLHPGQIDEVERIGACGHRDHFLLQSGHHLIVDLKDDRTYHSADTPRRGAVHPAGRTS
ncbi:hypothetical protein [Streptomyces sp. NPDC060194]|uniref:hypothetical protein n=1 Tax=Streptomyces sp. NPDC060194 TaxID=3347069 RepID=UPI003659851A